MEDAKLVKLQFWALVLISILFFLGAPSVWHYCPDSGIYIGTAQSIVETGQYRFNGYPNILYYPGFSSLLSLPIMLFGVNFHVLHLFCAAIVVASLWLARAYFSFNRYGVPGIFIPILMACTGILQYQVFRVRSDGTFIAVTLGALLLWRMYVEESNRWGLISCFVLVAFAPMVRFHGLFLCAAFAAALILKVIFNEKRSVLRVAMAMGGGIATLIPFAAWTWRNVHLYTPHTFNMANAFFFGQKGLAVHAPGFARVDWIHAEWMYPFYNIAYSIMNLGDTVFSQNITRLFPVEVVVIFIVGIALAGSFRWLKIATHMERAYVVLCLLFVLFWLGGSHSLYSKPRQVYLPFLPFILICLGLGLRLIHERLIKTRYHILSSALIGFLVLLILSNGVTNFFENVSPSNSSFYKEANHVLKKVKSFMDEKTEPGVPVATTDWGVMPFTLKRTCYQVLEDESHLVTLKYMNKYQTGYLVILDKLTRRPRVTRNMVEDLPHLFTLMLEVQPKWDRPGAAIYSVDLEGVQTWLNNASMKNSQG